MDSERPQDPNRLIEFIAATVEAMRDKIGSMDDKIGVMQHEIGAMQHEIGTVKLEMGTRFDSIEGRMDSIDGKMSSIEGRIDRIEGKMATKDAMEAGFAAVRGDIERVALRLDQVDRNHSLRTTALESEVSRIRSVVYLVVKDQPDLVRLLGGPQ
jgi:hypothetical protein